MKIRDPYDVCVHMNRISGELFEIFEQTKKLDDEVSIKMVPLLYAAFKSISAEGGLVINCLAYHTGLEKLEN